MAHARDALSQIVQERLISVNPVVNAEDAGHALDVLYRGASHLARSDVAGQGHDARFYLDAQLRRVYVFCLLQPCLHVFREFVVVGGIRSGAPCLAGVDGPAFVGAARVSAADSTDTATVVARATAETAVARTCEHATLVVLIVGHGVLHAMVPAAFSSL